MGRIHPCNDCLKDAAQAEFARIRTSWQCLGGTSRLLFENAASGQQLSAESSVIVEILAERIETGTWPEVTPEALNTAAAALETGSDPRFIEYGDWRVGAYNRPWTPSQ